MNVVGKVGSLISQGVYSVATPFHPFGGAVDIIVVQQQDGTYRSTPWYVRFGKFQGVLKGAEKIVRITVNDVEANFHMYLDNSGEAYFIKEVVSGESSDAHGVLSDSNSLQGIQEQRSLKDNTNVNNEEHNGNFCVNESGVPNGEDQLQDERVSLNSDQNKMAESDSDRRFYEFQDDQSSLDGSVELSEYGSNRYENLDSVDHYVESQDLNSEVVLVSIDGHMLTAPISSSERNADDLQLNTPQFHLGPGQGTELCEGNEDFGTGEGSLAADYLNDLGTSAPEVMCEKSCNASTDSYAFGYQLEVCEGDGEHCCQVQENETVSGHENNLCAHGNVEAAPVGIKKEELFQSCLELPALAMQDENVGKQDINSSLKIHNKVDDLLEKSAIASQPATENGDVGISRNGNGPTLCNSGPPESLISNDLQVEAELIEEKVNASHIDSDNISVHSVSLSKELEEHVDNAVAVEGVEASPRGSNLEVEYSKIEMVGSQVSATGDKLKTDSRLQISLCKNLLHGGMGLDAAADVFDAHCISEENFKLSAASIIKNENLVVRFQGRYLSWDKAAPFVLGMAAYGLDLPIDSKDVIPVDHDDATKPGDDGSGIASTSSGRRWRLWPIPFRRVKTLEHTASNSSSEEVFVDSEAGLQNQPVEPDPTCTSDSQSSQKQLLRTNVPTTEQISSLNLKEGQNMVTFSFSTRVLGLQQVDAHIYLWKWNARIVISDVDGTITKSDVLGQFMPLVGKDWTQSGVARLFCAIKENGYHLLFLSARAIVQAYLTRSFLLNLKQDGKALPSGPVVISPDGLFPSLYREVIRRAPHEFKIACLEDIKALFPSDYNPFYAGFGNRDTDELSYRKIGIPKGKIFIINPKGEVANSQHPVDVKTYTSLHTLVNDMFPPTSMIEQEDYNSWNYWKLPLPDLD
ncbi:Phosphatidate phosphatase [Bertholletia excelsa]